MSLQCNELSVSHRSMFSEFWKALDAAGDTDFFLPHAIDELGRESVLARTGRDIYLVLVYEQAVVGYGLLRGWDEGYTVPSLGIAIHPFWRGRGLGRLLMDILHANAVMRGATRVRLRVHQKNLRALDLYRSMGYEFEPRSESSDYLTGFRALSASA